MPDNPNRLPRQDASLEFPIPGDVWNKLCDMVEGANFEVTPPLQKVRTPSGGWQLQLSIKGAVVPLRLTATETGTGFYKGRAYLGSTSKIKDGTANLDLDNSGLTDPKYDNALVFDPNANNGGSSSLTPSSSSPVWAGGLQVGMTNENPSRGIYMLMGGSGQSRGQYEYQIYAMTAQNAPPSWIIGPIAHPKIT